MKITQVTLAMMALIGYALATGYGSGGYGGGSGGAGAGASGFGSGATAEGSSFGGEAAAGGSVFGGGAGGSRGFGSGSSRGSFGGGAAEAPKPYNFDYNSVDEQGNNQYRYEQGDQNGRVSGTYGYQDAQGLYRIVEYVADENGYRAYIRTNEPGVDGKQSPADVQLTAEQPPAGIQDRFTGGGAGAGGYSGGSQGNFGGEPAPKVPSIGGYSGAERGNAVPKSKEKARQLIGK